MGALRELLIAFDCSTALGRTGLEVDAANRYIEEAEPFKRVKTSPEACRAVLANLTDEIDPVQALLPRRRRWKRMIILMVRSRLLFLGARKSRLCRPR